MSRHLSSPHEDPAVADVEQILAAAGSTHRTPGPLRGTQPVAQHALWICACVTIDDSPTWLIYDTPTDGLAWSRVEDGVEPLELVKARRSAGGHADPAEVLRWLRGTVSDPWSGGGAGAGDPGVLDELRSMIRLD